MNGENDDIRIAQLLASRLCHDLVGPVGAVNAGLELLQEGAPTGGLDADALALAAKSAGQMGRRVTFFRIAFGAGLTGGQGPLAEARALAEGFMADGATRLDWADLPEGLAESAIPPETANILLNLVLLGAESLPRGGTLSVNFQLESPGNKAFFLILGATGERAGLKAQTLAGLAPGVQVADLDARSVHGCFARRLVERRGGDLAIETGEGQVGLRAGPFHLID